MDSDGAGLDGFRRRVVWMGAGRRAQGRRVAGSQGAGSQGAGSQGAGSQGAGRRAQGSGAQGCRVQGRRGKNFGQNVLAVATKKAPPSFL